LRLLSALSTVRSYSGPNCSCSLPVCLRANARHTTTASNAAIPITIKTHTHAINHTS
jgi:hypothetical protein